MRAPGLMAACSDHGSILGTNTVLGCLSVELVSFVVYADFIVELCAHRALLIYM